MAKLQRITLASAESLVIPEAQELVFLADFRCSNCQQRVAEVMSKMNREADAVVVSVLDKRVTLTWTNPKSAGASSSAAGGKNNDSIHRTPSKKIGIILRLLFPHSRG